MARAAKTAKGLTEKQERFALAYFEDPNASAAYRKAYRPKKMKGATVNKRAAELLKHGGIAGRVAELRAKVEAKEILTKEEVLRGLARANRFDPRRLYDDRGRLKPITELDDDTALELAGIEVEELTEGAGEDRAVIGNTVKVKFPDKRAAREQAMKHFGLFEKDNKQRTDPTALLLQWLNDRDAATGTHGLPVKY